MLKLPCEVTSLSTKHNFVESRIEYIVEVNILGQVFRLDVDEEFVSRLDQAASKPQQQPVQQQTAIARKAPIQATKSKTYQDKIAQIRNQKQQQLQQRQSQHEDIDYSIGKVDERPYDDYSDEEIEQL